MTEILWTLRPRGPGDHGRHSPSAGVNDLLRNSLKLGVATLITAALAMRFDRLDVAWYPLLAVLIVVDDNDDHTLEAASGRILGTMAGCLLTFLVHSVVDGWPGVLLTLLLMVPLLRLLGWQSALGSAGLIPLVFLMLPEQAPLNWSSAFHRALDAAVGCAVALAVGLLFWPRDGVRRLADTEEDLLRRLRSQLTAYRGWLEAGAPRPSPLPPAALSAAVERMDALLHHELAGPRWHGLRAGDWRRRVALWRSVRLHWVQWERLLAACDPPRPTADGPDPLGAGVMALAAHLLDHGPTAAAAPSPAPTPTPAPTPAEAVEAWTALALQTGRPLMTLLALAEEQRPLLASSRELAQLRRTAPWP